MSRSATSASKADDSNYIISSIPLLVQIELHLLLLQRCEVLPLHFLYLSGFLIILCQARTCYCQLYLIGKADSVALLGD